MTSPLDFLLEAARRAPIVPVLIVEQSEVAADLARALVDGGLTIAEVTLRTPSGFAVIEAMKAAAPELIVGAGTVLTGSDVENSISAGADFLVSPGMSPRLLDALGERRKIMIPGIATATEAMCRYEEGFGLLKLFPASVVGGVGALKGFASPLPHMRFMPTGGVTEADAGNYLALPNVFAVGGSWIASSADIAAADWRGISTKATRALARA
ncbi:bifunctional 4-hydroxy-2-oxoglutarate aldolase/2-dehydro-3-deoxy-phosphogluconate aldolase [Hyphomonas johnsonii]|uniref:2-dehydro-3-deoxy-phosphogluconate aldolase n=1 Tax=Hyphomonas johnsonii MHS-2 TaxID=1280950 RepID=A0A059FUJ6_9PROT|nr:bifunctional 4-hydroxy-2-oxoglutarate aldolase/2-dehydro-3-deoxy-phosphogluconate aldolase [Hyphomonas johnsonii]KCZ94344.1 2-dehydro-3-deoxyphosphogluconate aldolase [Hyphomonas johnsonii MHS-2]